jgi:hypothetical protein
MRWGDLVRLGAVLAFTGAAIVAAAGCHNGDAGSRGNADGNVGAAAAAVEQQLPGVWRGPAPCDGRLVVRTDGTYERWHYSPGDNHLSGAWSVRRDGGSPVLVLMCEASDEPDDVGKIAELAIVCLNADALEYRWAGQQFTTRYERDVTAKDAASPQAE